MKNQRARAIIVKQGSLLLIKRIFQDKEYWVFPGGGVEDHENNKTALIRECKEELGVDIKIIKLFTREKSDKKETMGDMEYYYEVEITSGVLGDAYGSEHKQDNRYSGKYAVTWEKIENIKNIDLRPNAIRDKVYEEYLNK